MQITNGLPQQLTQNTSHWRTEASEFDSGSNQGSRNLYRRQPKQQPKEENKSDEDGKRTLPAIKPGVAPAGGALRREVPPASNGEVFATDDGITPLPTLRRRSEAYERMLNIF